MKQLNLNGLLNRFIRVILFSFFIISTQAQAVVIELALLLDSSSSIGKDDFKLQTDAYKSIFNDSFYDNYVTASDTLYVTAFTFDTYVYVNEQINWTLIDSNASAASFGDLFDNFSYNSLKTNTAKAVDVAVDSILKNNINGDRKIIDISTDGLPYLGIDKNNPEPAKAITAAEDAVKSGVVVNAIGVGSLLDTDFLDDFTTAGGGFYTTAANFGAFQSALEKKLYREINSVPVNVPEPDVLALLAIGLVGFRLCRKSQLSSITS